MKVTAFALFSAATLAPCGATNFRSLVERVTGRVKAEKAESPAAADAVAERGAPSDQGARALQTLTPVNRGNCWGDEPDPAWHPTYSAGWSGGFCAYAIDCNSPRFTSELACCRGAYSGQVSGFCLGQLPSPPTTSPTETGGLDVFYPDYATPWPEAGCINTRPLPSGRPTYTTQLACCKQAYGGQMSGVCLSQLPSPPTTAPTDAGGADFWYPDYDTPWSDAGCSNALPLPYNNVNDRPNYPTQLACCNGAYGGQMSGVCLSQLPQAPTTSPTETGGLDVWYADYDTAWTAAGCINTRPLPSGRPTYATQLACCKGAYAGQMSGACLSQLPSPPTQAPTTSGGLDVYYPDYGTPWAAAGCLNTRPLPSGRPTYATQLACCKGAYAGQQSGACLAQLPSPPTASPVSSAGLDVYYPDYTRAFSAGVCINDSPIPSGRNEFATKVQCCMREYAGQTSDACRCDADPCFSCNCSGAATNPACTALTCN